MRPVVADLRWWWRWCGAVGVRVSIHVFRLLRVAAADAVEPVPSTGHVFLALWPISGSFRFCLSAGHNVFLTVELPEVHNGNNLVIFLSSEVLDRSRLLKNGGQIQRKEGIQAE